MGILTPEIKEFVKQQKLGFVDNRSEHMTYDEHAKCI